MGELFNFVMPFFSTPTNYAEMLRKLAGFAFYQVLAITFFLSQIPQIGSGLRAFDALIPMAADYHLTAVIIALIAALISNILPLHDRLSDLCGIRRRFDKRHIMIPLAERVGVQFTGEQLELLDQNRHHIMREVFYKFASSRDPDPLVDRHDIEHALSQWAWFWAFIEGTVFWAIGAVIAIAFGADFLGNWLLLVALILLLCALVFSGRLPRYALPQIEFIAADAKARKHVKSVFDAL